MKTSNIIHNIMIGAGILAILIIPGIVRAQTTLINPAAEGGFENGTTFAANGWTMVNGTGNTWQCGNAAPAYTGARGAFISNDGGTTWAYTLNGARTVHFYRDVVIPAAADAITLSYYWKGSGETGADRLLVYTAPTTTVPVAGTPASPSTTLTGATLVYTQSTMSTVYSQNVIALPASLAGSAVRIIFTWQNNNNGGTSPGIAVDNISLTYAFPPAITPGSNPSVCSGSTLAYLPYTGAVNNPDQYSIIWNAAALSAGFTNVTAAWLPAGAVPISVPSSAAPGSYAGTLTVINSQSGLSSTSYPITLGVTAYAAIGAAGPISGSHFVCQGASGVAYSVAAIAGATGYVWTLPAGAVITAGANTNNISVNFSGSSNTGEMYVSGTSGSCAGAASPAFQIYSTIVSNPVNIYGCPGNPVTFSITSSGAGLSYQWQEFSGVWSNLSNGGVYSGVNTEVLSISNPAGLNGRQYRCLVSGSSCPAATSAAATLSVLSAGLSGIKTVGTGGDYTTLKLAFDAINSSGLSGNLDLQIISNISDNNPAILNQYAACGNMGYILRIYPTGAARTLSGSVNGGQITLNGADAVIIDGRLGMSGAANSLILQNTYSDGSVIKLQSDACGNTIRYCDLQGQQNIATNGVVYIDGALATGNDNNTIDNCRIHAVNASTATPLNAIYAKGMGGRDNDHNTISNCNIYDFYSALYPAYGIRVLEGNTAMTIKSNSIYQSVARTEWYMTGISVSNTDGSDFTIENNYIGGSAPNCSGTWSISGSTYNNLFRGIFLDCSGNGLSAVKNNTIKGISLTTYSSTASSIVFSAIMVNSGRAEVSGNTIGDNSTGSITITVNDNGSNIPWIIPIYKNGDGDIINNSIGSFTINGSVDNQCGFTALQVTGNLINDVVISGNVIGNANTANSIQTAAGTTPCVTFEGIYFGSSGNYTTTISNNLIANITQQSTSTIPFFMGMFNDATAGTQMITGNTIRNISSATTRVATFQTTALMSAMTGIASVNTTNGGHVISGNQIHSFTASGTTAVKVFGIMCHHDAGTGSTISKNFIHSFSTTSNTATQVGIKAYTGISNVSNNMIRLGYTAGGTSVNSSPIIIGIWQTSTSACVYNYNSVYIGGTDATANAVNTSAFKRDAGSSSLSNNILYNARSGGSALHYAIVTESSTVSSNYNDLFTSVVANLGSYNGGTTARTLAAWRTGTGQDANSRSENPQFINATGSAALTDLHLNPASPEIGMGLANTVTSDYDNQQRRITASPNGPTIGADEVVSSAGANAYGIYSPAAPGGVIADCEIYAQGGTPGGSGIRVGIPGDANFSNTNISAYQKITATNNSCLYTDMTFTTVDASPGWLFGNGSNPASGSTSPMSPVQYSSIGRKSIIESSRLYRDFVNMTMTPPAAGLILGAPLSAGCPGTYSYTSSVAGSPGYTYSWSVIAPAGCSATIASPLASTTDVTFVNTTGVNQVFILMLSLSTECCGPLDAIVRLITINPGPLTPAVTGGPFTPCTGGSVTLAISGPNPTYSYEWFDAASGGNLLGSGSSFTINPVLSGSNSIWIEATNGVACRSPRSQVQINGTDTPAPAVANATTCGAGEVTLSVSLPISGATYNWYSGSCGGSLLQSSTSASYTTVVSSATTFYVQAVPVGCGAGLCASPAVTVSTPPNPIVWLGVAGGANSWFNPANWSNGCIPNCGTNVSIPNLAIDPDIGFNPASNAACGDITLMAGAILSFSNSKAELDICGNFTHSGIITTSGLGLVKFTGSTPQTYSKSGSGEFHDVTLDNSALLASLTLSGGDMVLDASGSFEFVNGLVNTGANYLVIKNTASAAIKGHSVSGYVNGNLRRYTSPASSYDFPLGNSDAYELATLDLISTSGMTYLNAWFSNPANAAGTGLPLTDGVYSFDLLVNSGGVSPTVGNLYGGVWTFTPDAGTADYGMTLNGRNQDIAGTIYTIVKRTTAGPGVWTNAGSYISSSNAAGVVSAVRDSYTGFSQFAIVRSTDYLPVTLLRFDAECRDEGVVLEWATASEQNSELYRIDRSADAALWETLEEMAAAGNSSSTIQYQFIDKTPLSEENYYRLVQMDYDGKFSIYGPVAARCEVQQLPAVQYFPNPFTADLIVQTSNLTGNHAVIRICNVLGETVFQKDIPGLSNSNNQFVLPLAYLAAGLYTIEMKTENYNNKTKIVKYR
jgi:hypothetical protein